MKMVNAKGEAVYFNRVMKNGREQFVVKALDGQHIMGRDRQKHSSRTFTISIHALREEGDSKNRDKISIFKQIIQHSARI